MKSSVLCLEIGPGLGTLTSSLLKKFERVLAIEYDEKLAKNLPKSFPGKKLKVINADFLDFDLELINEPYVVAGNIPYYITSPIIYKLLEAKNPPLKIVLLIQKEVAERILEVEGKSSFLSTSIKNLAEVEAGIVRTDVAGNLTYEVPKEYFTPPPKVDSAVILLEPRKRPLVDEKIIKLAKQGFSKPRKKLISNLNGSMEEKKVIFERLNLDLNARAADLNLDDWQKLASEIL